ncbi:vitamin K epoxide reductase family protein [Gordonia sp. ABSL11-1]|uniref:vitamin K epoxide reductase family protein n=1 Tax=Gordonia sp. ABSL11-1 TaxID=3053924 RepID=UPI002574391E|nr:vitamin K epoxide reductase family protein [Gordonia sp. ABSL11-1]MDL9948567.1 vitamin K epoxide reductase family protein [Gordonia sp. ABSL11-1]
MTVSPNIEPPVADDPADDDSASAPAERSGPWFTALCRVGPGASIAVLLSGIIGLVASATLTVERFHLLTDTNYTPSCSINPIISCGSVMVKPQAAIFGFPNPLIGIAAFAVIVVTGVLSVARIELPRWYWFGQSLATAAGFVMINWLAFQSVYNIHALCPYCMVVWTVTPIILVISIGRLVDDTRRGQEIRQWLWVLLPVWYAVVIVAIGVEFWDYWSTLI